VDRYGLDFVACGSRVYTACDGAQQAVTARLEREVPLLPALADFLSKR
jgi:hypothetical protein